MAKLFIALLLALIATHALARPITPGTTFDDQKNFLTYGGLGGYSGIGSNGLPFGGVGGVVGGTGPGGLGGGLGGATGIGGLGGLGGGAAGGLGSGVGGGAGGGVGVGGGSGLTNPWSYFNLVLFRLKMLLEWSLVILP